MHRGHSVLWQFQVGGSISRFTLNLPILSSLAVFDCFEWVLIDRIEKRRGHSALWQFWMGGSIGRFTLNLPILSSLAISCLCFTEGLFILHTKDLINWKIKELPQYVIPIHEVAYYREFHNFFNSSHFLMVTFLLQLKIGLFSQLYWTSCNWIIGEAWLVFSCVLLGTSVVFCPAISLLRWLIWYIINMFIGNDMYLLFCILCAAQSLLWVYLVRAHSQCGLEVL